MHKFFDDEDIADLLAELESENNAIPVVDDSEMEASQRRYAEIIKKHRGEDE